MTTEQVWTGWLYRLDGLQVVRGHILHTGIGDRLPVHPARLQAIERLVTTQQAGQLEQVKDRAPDPGHAEERSAAALLQADEMGKGPNRALTAQKLRQCCDGWCLQQRVQW